MTTEAKIVLHGSLVIIVMLFVIVLFGSPTTQEREARCRMYIAKTTDRSLEEIQTLCKQP